MLSFISRIKYLSKTLLIQEAGLYFSSVLCPFTSVMLNSFASALYTLAQVKREEWRKGEEWGETREG